MVSNFSDNTSKLLVANRFVKEEKWPRLCGQQVNQNKISSEMIKEYW